MQLPGGAGRITSYSWKRRTVEYEITLTGICALLVSRRRSIRPTSLIAQVEANFSGFADDLAEAEGDDGVDRVSLLKVFRDYLTANDMSADWDQVKVGFDGSPRQHAGGPGAAMRRATSRLCSRPQDLKSRADVLIALTEMALARQGSGACFRPAVRL